MSKKLFNVKDFGAVADGMTLDTAAVQSAVDACAEAGGGVVFFPRATYVLATVFLKSGVHIEFDYCYIRPEPCIQISTSNDTFVCYPEKKNVVMKLLFATEELYKKEQEERALRRQIRKEQRENKE